MKNYYPLGTIVLLKGGTQKLIIISRALEVKNGDETFFFDYGAVTYPIGLIEDKMAYFNNENISKVIAEGYADVEDENFVETINEYLDDNPDIKYGNPENWVEQPASQDK